MTKFGKSHGGGRRGSSRQTAPLCATLVGLSRSRNALLIDISATGARLCSEDPPEVGDEHSLSICQIRIFCTVRWQKGDDFGVQFYEPLKQIDVIEVRRAVVVNAGLSPAMKAARDDWILGVAR